jgi:aspartate aminotransferase/aminotransferase
LLSDEAYSDFVKEENFISLGSIDREKTHSIIFNSISKNYGISGWRLGYIIGNKSLINGVLKVNQHLITCPATILELYVEKYFQDILDITLPQISSLLDHRKELSDFMKKIGLNKMDGTATFYFFVSILPSRLNSEEFCTKLLQEGKISTVPGKGYGDSCDKYIRVSFGTASMRENKRGLLAIKQMIEATSL